RTAPRRAVAQDLPHPIGARPVLSGPRPHGLELPRDPLRQLPLALHAPEPRGAAAPVDLGAPLVGREEPVQREDVAYLRASRVAAPDALRVRHRGAHALRDLLRRVQHPDRVAARLAHLRLAIQPADPAGLAHESLRLREVLPELAVPPACDLARQLEML